MEDRQLLAIVVVVSFVIGGGISILFSGPSDSIPVNTSELIELESYISARGDFDYIDVFTWGEDSGSEWFSFHAHITTSEQRYLIIDPTYDATDRENDKNYIWRISLWICVDGNLTEYRFMVINDIFYSNIMFGEVEITIYIDDTTGIW